jgi:hypothetical protein
MADWHLGGPGRVLQQQLMMTWSQEGSGAPLSENKTDIYSEFRFQTGVEMCTCICSMHHSKYFICCHCKYKMTVMLHYRYQLRAINYFSLHSTSPCKEMFVMKASSDLCLTCVLILYTMSYQKINSLMWALCNIWVILDIYRFTLNMPDKF